MTPITTAIPYFSLDELSCKGTGIVKLDPRFAEALPLLREAWGEPCIINEHQGSVCRTPEHNNRVGGNPRSLHMTENPAWPTFGCMAIDWPWHDMSTVKRLEFAQLAWSMGWSVGLHDSFCHLDRRADMALPNLPQAVFLYGRWGGQFGAAEITSPNAMLTT